MGLRWGWVGVKILSYLNPKVTVRASFAYHLFWKYKVSFSISKYDFVSIKVYDIKGRLISTLVENYFNQGIHTLTWDGTYLSSGQYLIKMESGSFSKTQTISLIK